MSVFLPIPPLLGESRLLWQEVFLRCSLGFGGLWVGQCQPLTHPLKSVPQLQILQEQAVPQVPLLPWRPR